MNKLTPMLFLCSILFAAPTSAGTEASSSPSDDLFSVLVSLCGKVFSGEMTFPEDGLDAFAGKKLVAKIEQCSDTEVRVPFHVGEDESRTWVFTKLSTNETSQIELKHDHRHKDGTPDEVTMYGGMSKTTRLSSFDQSLERALYQQSFPADKYTQQLIPEASTNIWTVSINQSLDTLTYYLSRHGKPRFEAKLKLESKD